MKKLNYLLAALVGVTLMITVYSCGGGGASSDSPGAVTEAFYDKLESGDYDGMMEMFEGTGEMSEEQKKQTRDFLAGAWQMMQQQKGKVKSIEIVKENINEAGDEATVEIKMIFENGEEQGGEQKLVKVDGKWKMKQQL